MLTNLGPMEQEISQRAPRTRVIGRCLISSDRSGLEEGFVPRLAASRGARRNAVCYPDCQNHGPTYVVRFMGNSLRLQLDDPCRRPVPHRTQFVRGCAAKSDLLERLLRVPVLRFGRPT